MLEVDQVRECKQRHGRGMKIRAIARELGISRNTVRSYLRGERLPGQYQMSAPRAQPVAGAIRELVRALLVAEQDPLQHAYLPLEYEPGEDAQVDFLEAWVDDREEGRMKIHVLLVRACYSGRCYAYIAPNQTREALLEGLMRAFEFFGGDFRTLWFDNLSPAVKRVLKGRTRELQFGFQRFQAHYGFQAEFCSPGKGNEKGGVEGEVKYSRIGGCQLNCVNGRAGEIG
jgi:transposase